jgi:hypothetical protein
MKNKLIIQQILIIAIILLLPGILHAQPGFTDDTIDAPIDGGLSLLIAGGVGYGIKKMRKPPTPKGE